MCLSRTSRWPPLLLPRGHLGPLGSPESGCLLQALLVRHRPRDPQAGSRAHPSLADEELLGLGGGADQIMNKAHFPRLSDVLLEVPEGRGAFHKVLLILPALPTCSVPHGLKGLQQAPRQGTLPTAELFRGWGPHGQTPCRGAGAGPQGPPPRDRQPRSGGGGQCAGGTAAGGWGPCWPRAAPVIFLPVAMAPGQVSRR